MLDSGSSSSKRTSDFNAGDSRRSYIGFVDDENTESSLLVKIDKDLFINNDVCEEGNLNFNDINFCIIVLASIFLKIDDLASINFIGVGQHWIRYLYCLSI